MTAYILCYETFTLFETVLISYMFNAEESSEKAVMVGIDGDSIRSFEGILVQPDKKLSEIDFQKDDLLIIPGGDYHLIPESDALKRLLDLIFKNQYHIAAICSGITYLSEKGYLEGYCSTLTDSQDIVIDRNLITGNANAFVEFAIEISNAFHVLGDYEGYLETIKFFKNQI